MLESEIMSCTERLPPSYAIAWMSSGGRETSAADEEDDMAIEGRDEWPSIHKFFASHNLNICIFNPTWALSVCGGNTRGFAVTCFDYLGSHDSEGSFGLVNVDDCDSVPGLSKRVLWTRFV